jgi:hypothetical protein
MAMARAATAAALVGLAAGCYTTAIVPAAAVRRASTPARAPLAVTDLGGGQARLGPRSEVRIRRRDGSASRWYGAGELVTSSQGLGTAATLPLGDSTRALVGDVGLETGALLTATAPEGGRVDWQGEGFALHASRPGQVAAWAAAASARVVELGGSAGTWRFARPEGGWLSGPIPGSTLAATPPPALATRRLIEGTPWQEVAALEIRGFDPFLSVSSGLGVTGLVALAILLGGNPSGLGDDRVGFDKGVRVEDDRLPHRGMLLEPGASAPTDGRPLFTPRARRRDLIRLIAAGDLALSRDAGLAGGGGGVGIRVCEFVELTARLRAVEHAGATRLLGGGRLSLHVDSDARPLTALTLGMEVLGRPGGGGGDGGAVMTLAFPAGPRLGFGPGGLGFASVLVSPSFVFDMGDAPDHRRTTTFQLLASLELGLAL